MNFQQKMITIFVTIFSALFFLTYNFPALTVKADSLPEETAAQQDNTAVSDETPPQETAIPESETIITESTLTESVIAESVTTESTLTESVIAESVTTEITTTEATTTEATTTETMTEEIMAEEEVLLPSSENPIIPEEESSKLFDEEMLPETTELAFDACIDFSPLGYRVKGTFTEFPPDIIKIRPLYSLNGKTYQECDIEWNSMMIEGERIAETKCIFCLNANNEPLKSYLEGSLNRFYLKLRLSDSNGISYETQTVLINRGAPQPIPEEITPLATFASSMRVREMRPFRYYGRYQITVKETAAPKEISSVLPETLPIEVQFMKKGNTYATGIIDCPVTWKSLTLPSLTAGESVTIEDAAEEIIIPSGTLVRTPVGVFRFDEPLRMEDDYNYITDEVRLVLNIVSEKEKPTGVLSAEWDGLELAFHQKPTGATAIQVYTISENEKKWTKLPKSCGLALLDEINTQPSTAGSGYALVLGKEQEPYRSYLAAQAAGEQPTPFFIGLKIKGGVYNGQQLILSFPDTYEKPLSLPKLGGAGGNESNAGAANKGDSTSEGQRPNLPQNTDTKKEEQNANLFPGQTAKNTTTENTTTENMTAENTVEQSTQPDSQNQQTRENKQTDNKPKTSALMQIPDKVQAAVASGAEENALDTASTADMQTETSTENAASLETSPAADKLTAALTPSGQTEKTNYTTDTGSHPLFLFIAAAAVIGFGVTLYIRRTRGRTDKKS